jgi:class 3 adenylate cyclase
VAARVAAAAAGGEVLVSEQLVPHLDARKVALRRRRRFAAKGTPAGLRVYLAEPISAG